MVQHIHVLDLRWADIHVRIRRRKGLNMKMMILIAALILIAATMSAAAEPDGLATVTVTAFGAKADGTTDDTAAFQKALDSAADKGGIVLAPAGTYLIAGSLVVPQGVTLRGVWEAPHHADIGKGTVIHATGGAGDENATPLISLNQSSCVKGIILLPQAGHRQSHAISLDHPGQRNALQRDRRHAGQLLQGHRLRNELEPSVKVQAGLNID